ncbi:MAG: SDR family NAD(P)-dependent oxidoreductase, partial [Pseudanabaenales cyanobacterium]|nr:SDR family NAD(P)-dependent oxidoreductase [Pseudanabaenales cyanobacterium]
MHRLPFTSHPLPLISNVVLITGCSSGIGRALAEQFIRRGYRVYA